MQGSSHSLVCFILYTLHIILYFISYIFLVVWFFYNSCGNLKNYFCLVKRTNLIGFASYHISTSHKAMTFQLSGT